jgi:hypothetical protein
MEIRSESSEISQASALAHAHDLGGDVIIYRTDELDVWVWVVDCVEDPGFWVDTFPTKKEAIAFCKTFNLTWETK